MTVDSFVKWRIFDVKQYYVSVQGDEIRAATRLKQTISDGLQVEFGRRTVHDVVSGQRDEIMEKVRTSADADLRRIGVEIVDVRLKRVDLPDDVSASVFRRMDSERKRVASQLRSTGSAEAETIRADSEKQREVILAEAYRDAQKMKGEGDAKAAAIYAQAFSQNPEFYSFYRSMEAYKASFPLQVGPAAARAQLGFLQVPAGCVRKIRRQEVMSHGHHAPHGVRARAGHRGDAAVSRA